MNLTLSDILAAQKTIAGKVVRTPLLPSRHLSAVTGAPFFLKMETMQPTGAFKLRGATNAAQNVPEGTHTLTCCSTGNHGRGVAYAARNLGLKAVICMSSLVPQTKIDGIKALGAEARIVGSSQDDALAECLALAQEDGIAEISPFDDPFVIAGQGTVGLEILEEVPDLKTLLVPLSGGGLAAGVALAAKTITPSIRLIGLTMDRGAAMKASIDAGHPVEVPEVASLADSLGGGIGLTNKLSFRMCRDLLDDVVLVTEEEIYRAMQVLYYEDSHVAEGACVVGIAACLSGKLTGLTGPVATIITGRNVDMDQFTRVVTGQDIKLGDYHLKGAAYGA
ncbi:hydroxyectoine utilization dehydratase EutB [Roseibium sediminicola]|uniref:Hydroxyectoine utilization dehydratase EutB n=1 Tax=Roseibium sediminicola TaxID=2933272 RepID=A0ABT0GPL9_9HYPH|nr:hydroxyectoine utilization dehydratase EutB [Roseibium sp. CAU 1639]MCK7611369.1 hydroxyectoine utilization dehydratase EutB [Roseibium sp. CAU 1639]